MVPDNVFGSYSWIKNSRLEKLYIQYVGVSTGDIIIPKKERKEYLGDGVVESDY